MPRALPNPPFPCFHRLSLRFSPHRTKHLCWAAHEPVPPPVQFSSSPSPLPSKRGVIFKITPFVLQRRWAGWVLGAWRPKGFRSSHSLPPTSPPHLHLHLHLLVCVLSSGLKPKKKNNIWCEKTLLQVNSGFQPSLEVHRLYRAPPLELCQRRLSGHPGVVEATWAS